MARIVQSGYELNTTTSGVEMFTTGSVPNMSVSSRTGSVAISCVGTSNINASANISTSFLGGPFYFRFYLNISALPNGTTTIFALSGFKTLKLTSTGALQLFNSASQVGSDSSALSTGQWYRIEVLYNQTPGAGASVLEGKIDGTVFATASNLTLSAGTIQAFQVGINIGNESKTGTLLFDDVAVNDNNGSFQTSYPGVGQLVHILPDSAGDANAWTRGGTDTGANYSQVNEVTPDDITTYNLSTTLNQEDLFNLAASPSSIGTNDTINVVGVGVRFRADAASSNPTFKLEIESSSGGTIEQSAGITPNSTTWRSNAIGATTLQSPPLILYDLPGASTTAWTKADLDTAQIGYKLTTDNTNNINISTIWLSVDSTPNAGGGGATTVIIPQRMRMGMGA